MLSDDRPHYPVEVLNHAANIFRMAGHVLGKRLRLRLGVVVSLVDDDPQPFPRRIKTQTVLPSAETAAMLFWALLASGQINMRKVDGWQTLATKPLDQPIDLAA